MGHDVYRGTLLRVNKGKATPKKLKSNNSKQKALLRYVELCIYTGQNLKNNICNMSRNKL